MTELSPTAQAVLAALRSAGAAPPAVLDRLGRELAALDPKRAEVLEWPTASAAQLTAALCVDGCLSGLQLQLHSLQLPCVLGRSRLVIGLQSLGRRSRSSTWPLRRRGLSDSLPSQLVSSGHRPLLVLPFLISLPSSLISWSLLCLLCLPACLLLLPLLLFVEAPPFTCRSSLKSAGPPSQHWPRWPPSRRLLTMPPGC